MIEIAIYLIIIVAVMWTTGFFIGRQVGRRDTQIEFETITLRQAAKWLLIHEKHRHQNDIIAMNHDLKNLSDVEVPAGLKEMAGKIRFEV